MDLTSDTRTTAAAAAVAMLGGLGLILHGMWRDQPTHSLAGVVLSMIALTATILAVVHHWVTDTRAERIALAAAQREAQAERARAFAAQAALENEQGRLYRDLAGERAAIRGRLEVERAAMQQEFEESRSQLVAEAMETLASWMVSGKVSPPERQTGNLIRFPKQQPVQAPQRDRSREHGVVGP
jgi:hypothetical protein